MENQSDNTLGQIAVQDGTSNTLMFGENIGGVGVGSKDRVCSWFGAGAMGTYYGLGRGNTTAAQGGSTWYRFSARHAAVVQFCFGDCSTRGVRYGTTTTPGSTDWWVLIELSGRKDGGNRNTAALLD
jgi:hypothetical protein